MSKKRGLSLEEKRERMLQLFYEKKDVFQLKDLEKVAPKEKGIVAQSVKDVVQSLADDGLIDSDKIGTSIYFWAFASKAVNKRKNKIDELESHLNESRKKLKTLEDQIASARSGREETALFESRFTPRDFIISKVDRVNLLSELEKLTARYDELKAIVQQYQDSDPEVLEEVKKSTHTAMEAANRWTDNIFSVMSWCKKKFFIENSILHKQFGIPEELDYVC